MLYTADREPLDAWVAACRDVAPPTDALSHLTIRWVPGTREHPVQRWCVFECIPRAALTLANGEDHPLLGVLEPGSGDPMLRWAWEYLGRTGTLPVGLWAVQGTGGGHPIAWTREEQVFARAGLLQPETLPALGAQCYAEPDRRTWGAIQQRSHLRRTITDAYTARVVARQLAEQQARAADVTQTEDAMRELASVASRALVEHARVIDPATERRDVGALVTDDDLARYIETGDLTVSRS